MNRISGNVAGKVLGKTNLLFGCFNAVSLWLLYVLVSRSGPGIFAPIDMTWLKLVVLPALIAMAAFVSLLIPKVITRWMIDRHPLLGSAILTIVYYYTLYLAAAVVTIVAEGRFTTFDNFAQWVIEHGWYLLATPAAFAVLASLVFCPYALVVTLVGAGTFCFMKDRRDYL